jgi:hypothetical protein
MGKENDSSTDKADLLQIADMVSCIFIVLWVLETHKYRDHTLVCNKGSGPGARFF